MIGGHGDTMVATVNHTKISGKPLSRFLEEGKIKKERLNEIIDRTKKGGAEIVKFLKKGKINRHE
mgnify:FL=1